MGRTVEETTVGKEEENANDKYSVCVKVPWLTTGEVKDIASPQAKQLGDEWRYREIEKAKLQFARIRRKGERDRGTEGKDKRMQCLQMQRVTTRKGTTRKTEYYTKFAICTDIYRDRESPKWMMLSGGVEVGRGGWVALEKVQHGPCTGKVWRKHVLGGVTGETRRQVRHCARVTECHLSQVYARQHWVARHKGGVSPELRCL